MSVWTTKTTKTDREYIVIQHKLKAVDYTIQGIKFRGGYAVVEKNSKAYYMLKKTPLLKECVEYPLIHLKKLPFITRTQDVKTIFGQDVYYQYLKQLQPVIEEQKVVQEEQQVDMHINIKKRCQHKTKENELCCNDAVDVSPSGFCKKHILDEPCLSELGLTIPKFMTVQERNKFKDKVIVSLAKYKPENKEQKEIKPE